MAARIAKNGSSARGHVDRGRPVSAVWCGVVDLREVTMTDPSGLTMDALRARLRAAGVTIPEARLEMVRRLLGEALAPLGTVDSREIRAVEPAVRFATEPAHRDQAGP
jgi:hypothetical protein